MAIILVGVVRIVASLRPCDFHVSHTTFAFAAPLMLTLVDPARSDVQSALGKIIHSLIPQKYSWELCFSF